MASRTLGVHAKDRPAIVPVSAGSAVINVAGLMFLSEKGPASVKEVFSSSEWEAIYGGYRTGMYGKYEVDGFFQNLQGQNGSLLCRRYVSATAVAASKVIDNGDTEDSISLQAGYLGEVDKGVHGNKILFKIAHSNKVEDQLAAELAISGTEITVGGAVNFQIGDYIKISNGVDSTSFKITAKNEAENKLTITPASDKLYGVSPTSGSQRWGFTVAKTGASASGLANDATVYTATITIDGVALPITVTGSAAQTLALVVSAIGTDIGAAGTASFDATGNGFIKVVSATTGITSTVAITDGTLFSTLTDHATTVETAVAGKASSTVKSLNFDLTVYRKNDVGVIEKQEEWKFLSPSSSTANYYVTMLNNIYRGSKVILAEDLGAEYDASYENLLPVENSSYIALASGSDGAAPINSDWTGMLTDFDTFKNMRYLACSESVTKTVNDAGENYCKSRGDAVWFSNLQSNQSYDELLQTGMQYVVSNDSYRMNNAQWLEVNDPIGIGEDPTLYVPNVGFIMGHAIFHIAKYGYQRVPAGIQESLKGIVSVYGDQILDDTRRTRLADVGINTIQFISGSGICLRNARMGSTNKAYKWFNQIFMRIFYKVTFKESFEILENVEAGEALLSQMFNAVRDFMLSDYTGNARTGYQSAFLKYAGTKFEDVVTIICDASNNEIADVLSGMVTIDIYFTPPPPAESIEIGVGISLKIQARSAA